VSFTPPRRLPWLLLIALADIVLDRLTKAWISKHIPMGGEIQLIPHVLDLSHWVNQGAAFSLFASAATPNTVRWGLVAFTLVAALVVFIAMIRLGSRFTLTTVALALILGGALGNAHDRIAYGWVVDFIDVHWYGHHWPDFNVADSSIVIGACMLLLDSLLPKKKQEAETRDQEPETGGQ
jgi:signal peptidase II